MKFYFSAEYSGDISEKIHFILNNILRKIEDFLKDKKYGEEIVCLTAIPMILDDRFSDHKERKYISRKERISDVRLRIDYQNFLEADFNECCKLIYKNCINSFYYVYEKSLKQKNGDFYKYYDCFIEDFTNIFDNLKNRITSEQIEKFNNFSI